MSEMSPANMLREYRRQSDDQMREQATEFRSLSAVDQRELIFWMIMHLTAGLQHVHSLIEPGDKTKTRSFSDIETPTQ